VVCGRERRCAAVVQWRGLSQWVAAEHSGAIALEETPGRGAPRFHAARRRGDRRGRGGGRMMAHPLHVLLVKDTLATA